MRYIVNEEYQLPDDAGWEIHIGPGTVLIPGDTIMDGDLEPDIIPILINRGVIEPDIPKPVSRDKK